MFKIITIIGARPQIIKAAALSRAIKNNFEGRIKEIIVHTGQHYDENMSEVFFRELGIPAPDYNLNAGSGSHGRQTGLMLAGIEEILEKEKPSAIVLYGDTNSTLAGAIAASKIHVPVVHIEAGLRSYNKKMPEEINRIMCDHVSSLLFSPTQRGVDNLKKEGFNFDSSKPVSMDNPKVYHCGDVMYDNSLHFSKKASETSDIISRYGLQSGQFFLATIHRNNNTDDPQRLESLFTALLEVCEKYNSKLVLPIHPRTQKLLEKNLTAETFNRVRNNSLIMILPPASFLEMIELERNCRMVLTDSGGVQKESFFFQKPCVILRPETEWVELVEAGTALITDVEKAKIVSAVDYFMKNTQLNFPSLYGDGNAANFICEKMLEHISVEFQLA